MSSRLISPNSSPSVFRVSTRSYYPSTPAQRAQVAYVLPVVCAVPVFVLMYVGWPDLQRKQAALKLTISGGEGWKPERRKVRADTAHRDKKGEE